MFSRNKIGMLVAEFLGTGVLTAVVLAVGKSNIGIPYFISLAVGLALVMLITIFGSISGAHFNPAITLGLWSARRVKTVPAVLYILAQFLGAVAAYYLYTYFVNTHLTNSGKFESRVLVAEALGTFVFAMGWAAVVYQKLQGGKAAFAMGSALTVGMMMASVGSASMLNPAIAWGAHVWVWGTYALGPVLGAVIGINLYALLFAPADALMESPATDTVKKKKK
jgi:aquaporin Z